MVFVITFTSSHQAMFANKAINKNDLVCEVIPTPREISSECGFSLLIYLDDQEHLKLYLKKNQIKYDKVYRKKGEFYEDCRW